MFRPINVRKLVALDMAVHGNALILIEFGAAVLFSIGLGLWLLAASRAQWQFSLGIYLLAIAVNYLPLLIYSIAIARKGSAVEEVKAEIAKGRSEVMRYTLQSFLLVLPLVVPLLALHQASRNRVA